MFEKEMCVWSQIADDDRPGVGKNGRSELAPKWAAMSKAGFHLVGVATQPDHRSHIYIFERCQ